MSEAKGEPQVRFTEGDSVFVATLRNNGTVAEVLKGDRYRVVIGSLSTVCSAATLSPAKGSSTAPTSRFRTEIPKASPPPQSVDLHGLTTSDAVRKVESYLDQAILAGLSHVKIIHGLGTGRVQGVVHEYLRSLNVVRHFKVNEWNPGETDVYL